MRCKSVNLRLKLTHLEGVIVFGLTAYGGGSSSKSESLPETTPNAFTLSAIACAAVNTEVTSAAVTITGIDGTVLLALSAAVILLMMLLSSQRQVLSA